MSLPSTWREVALADLADTVDYGFTTKACAEPLGPKFLRITDIVPDTVNWDAVPFCQIDEEKKDKYRLREGDIVIARTGATTGYAKHIRRPPDAIFASYLVRIRVRSGVDDRFVGLVVESDLYKRYTQTHMGGSAQPNANARVLASFPVPLPPLPTQRKIAGILSAYDDLIENNLRRIRILEEMAQALYRAWFVHFRFPGYHNARFVDSPLGKIPEGWEARQLGDVAEVNARSLRKNELPAEILYVNISSVSPGKIETIESLSAADAPGRARRVVRHGDVIWSCVRPNRRSYSLIVEPRPNMIVSTGFAVLTALDVPFTFLYSATATEDFATYLANHATGAAYPAVTAPDFERAALVVPPTDLLERFHSIVEPMVLLRHKLTLACERLRLSRDLLLPRLISGELDVSDLDIEVPDDNDPTPEPPAPSHAAPTSRMEPAAAEADESDDAPGVNDDEDQAEAEAPASSRTSSFLDEDDTDAVMAAFRKAARNRGAMDREEILKEVSLLLGYERLGKRIKERLKGHLRAAIRRKIIGTDGPDVWIETPSMDTYECDELVDFLCSVMHNDTEYDRDDVIRAVANRLGFRRLRDTVVAPITSAINAAIRRGLVAYEGSRLWRNE